MIFLKRSLVVKMVTSDSS